MIDPDCHHAIRHRAWGIDATADVALSAPANRSRDCRSVLAPHDGNDAVHGWAGQLDRADHVSDGAMVLLGS